MECVANFRAFNCSQFQIVCNSEYEEKQLFSENEYKLISCSHTDDAKDMVHLNRPSVSFKYGDKIIVSHNTSQSHKVFVSNPDPEIFGMNDYIELHMDDPSSNQFSNAFYNALTVIDDKIICVTNHNDSISPIPAAKILTASYVVFCNETRPQIKAEHVDNPIQRNAIQNMQFIVPFCVEMTTVSIYVQLEDDLDFVSFKTFIINQNHHQKYPQIQYLIDILMTYNVKIESADRFWTQIGFNCNEWTERISIMKKKFHHLVYQSTLLNRLHHELHIIPKDILQVLSTKFKSATYYSMFGHCVYKIDLDQNEDNAPFVHCNYKFIGVQNEETKENEVEIDNGMRYKYNNIMISNSTSQSQSYKVWVSNPELFGTNDYIELQYIDDPSFNQFSNAFYNALTVIDDRIICVTNHNHFITSTAAQISNARYVVLCNETKPQIKAEHVDNAIIIAIQLDVIQNMQFIIPFCADVTTVSIYVQLEEGLDFVSFKTFIINQNHHQKHPQIQYLIDILTTYKVKIESADRFWTQIGFNCNEWTERISIMKKKFHHLLYKPSLLKRLYHELHIMSFEHIWWVLSKKFERKFERGINIEFATYTERSGYEDVYGCHVYKIWLDEIDEDPYACIGYGLKRCTYKLIGVQNKENNENEVEIDNG
eukprot:278283_1